MRREEKPELATKKKIARFFQENRGVTPSVTTLGVTHPSDATVTSYTTNNVSKNLSNLNFTHKHCQSYMCTAYTMSCVCYRPILVYKVLISFEIRLTLQQNNRYDVDDDEYKNMYNYKCT